MIYMTLEYREGHEAVDIQRLLNNAGEAGWHLHTVLPEARVLVLERALLDE